MLIDKPKNITSKGKQVKMQHLERGEKADFGTTEYNRMTNQYAKDAPVNDDDFSGAFTGKVIGRF